MTMRDGRMNKELGIPFASVRPAGRQGHLIEL